MVQASVGHIQKFILLALVMMLTLSACSTTSIGLRFLYSRFDNTLNERILSYADFDSDQKSAIRQAVDSYVDWHRQHELPRYADFAADLNQQLQSGLYTEDDVLASIRRLRDLSDHGFLNSPVVTAGDFLQGLSDEQVDQIRVAFGRRDERFRERQKQRSEDGPEEVIDRIVSYVGRIGINLNTGQREIIARGFEHYRWRPDERRRHWQKWEEEFLAIMGNRNAPGFKESVSRHLSNYHAVPRNADPATDAWNQRNSARILHDLLKSLDPVQKQILVKRLNETRRVLLDMSGIQTS